MLIDNKEFIEYKGEIVIIMSTSKCNANCKHCYISFDGNFSGKELFEITNNFKKRHSVYINGTEPLMNEEYLNSYKISKYNSPITNGLVFYNNYKYIDKLKEVGIKELRISYHFDMHELISPVKKEFLEELFNEIRKRDLNLTIMCSISSINYNKIDLYCEQAIKLGATSIKFTNFINQGKAKEMDSKYILKDEQYKEFFRLLHKMREKYDKNVLEIRRCGSFGPDTYGKSNFKCDAGTNCVCITPDYKVYPCLFLCKKGNEIGFYKDGKIYIDKDFKNDGKRCLSKDKYNDDYILS